MTQNFHIGRLIRQKLNEQGRTQKWLAKELKCEYSTLYKKLQQYYIYTDLLLKISEILQEDFFAYFSEILANKEK